MNIPRVLKLDDIDLPGEDEDPEDDESTDSETQSAVEVGPGPFNISSPASSHSNTAQPVSENICRHF